MKDTQVQNKERKSVEKIEKGEIKVSKIQVISSTQLPKFGLLMQTEY